MSLHKILYINKQPPPWILKNPWRRLLFMSCGELPVALHFAFLHLVKKRRSAKAAERPVSVKRTQFDHRVRFYYNKKLVTCKYIFQIRIQHLACICAYLCGNMPNIPTCINLGRKRLPVECLTQFQSRFALFPSRYTTPDPLFYRASQTLHSPLPPQHRCSA